MDEYLCRLTTVKFCTWGNFGRHPFCQVLCTRSFLIGQPFWAAIGQQGKFWIVGNGTWLDWNFRFLFFFVFVLGPYCFWQSILFFRFHLFGILETVDFSVCPCQKNLTPRPIFASCSLQVFFFFFSSWK